MIFVYLATGAGLGAIALWAGVYDQLLARAEEVFEPEEGGVKRIQFMIAYVLVWCFAWPVVVGKLLWRLGPGR